MKPILAAVLALALASCAGSSPTAPTAVAVAPIPVVVTPEIVTTPPPVAVTEEDCSLWANFTYDVRPDYVMLWNHSSTCARETTWRAFAYYGSDWAAQFPISEAQVLTVAPSTMGAVVQLTFNAGAPTCGVTIQIDGDRGRVPDMDFLNASFPPGKLFQTPACEPAPPPQPPPPPPVAVCVEPAWGPWTVVPKASASTLPCSKTERRTRTACDGTVEIETRVVAC